MLLFRLQVCFWDSVNESEERAEEEKKNEEGDKYSGHVGVAIAEMINKTGLTIAVIAID